MTDFTNYAENLVVNWLLTNGAATRPTAWYCALHTSDPGETGATGELSGNGYARQSVTFSAASSGATSNTAQLTFGPNTSANWGTISHVSVWDALTTGNCLWKAALGSSKTVNVGDSLVIAAGDLDFSVD